MKRNKSGSLKNIVKTAIVNSLGYIGSFSRRVVPKKSLVVIVYHDVSDDPSEFSRTFNLNVNREVFEKQIRFIKKNFSIIDPDELLNGNIPSRSALISFDDGFKSYFKNAVPILRQYNIPSIIFLNMEPVKGGIFWPGMATYLFKFDGRFRGYLKEITHRQLNENSLFLSCSKKIVEDYIKNTGVLSFERIYRFVGEFASESDLMQASLSRLVFFGNHLFSHELPVSLSDDEFLKSFAINQSELEKYPNYRKMFSFPFGQPGSSYSLRHIKLLLGNNVSKIFSSAGYINRSIRTPCLDRVALDSVHNTTAKICGQINFQDFLKRCFLKKSVLTGYSKENIFPVPEIKSI